MPDLSDVRSFLADEHGLATVGTVQTGGARVLSSVVNCGVHPHLQTGEECVAFVSRGSAARLGHIRAGSEVTLTARRGWRWVGVTGPAQIVGPDDGDALDAESLRLLLRSVFQAAGGQHDDYDDYDRVMAQERRAVVFVVPARIIGNS